MLKLVADARDHAMILVAASMEQVDRSRKLVIETRSLLEELRASPGA
jgi:hypothetical protein